MSRYDQNIDRVRNFVALYEDRISKRGRQGRAKTKDTDLLRGAVVFLHATFEDLCRTTLEVAWTSNPDPIAATLRFPQQNPPSKELIKVSGLLQYRAISVQDLLDQAFHAYLEKATFNKDADFIDLFNKCALNVEPFRALLGDLDAMAKRRHQIVHRADRSRDRGSGNYKAKAINRHQVGRWIDAVEQFRSTLRSELGTNAQLLDDLLGDR